MEYEFNALTVFFENNQEIFKKTNIEYITHQSIFNDMNGSYFLASMYKECPDDEDYLSEDFDIICQKFGSSSEFNSTVGYILMQNECTIDKNDTLEDFLEMLPDRKFSSFHLSQKLDNQLPDTKIKLRKNKI